MSVQILVKESYTRRVRRRPLRDIAARALRAESAGPQSVSIIIVGDATIRKLNAKFHGVNAPTDVLSFSSDEEAYLGDIIISYPTALRNARTAGWRVGQELTLLVLHGVLHLLGYDDQSPRTRTRMWKRQKEILGMEIATAEPSGHVRMVARAAERPARSNPPGTVGPRRTGGRTTKRRS